MESLGCQPARGGSAVLDLDSMIRLALSKRSLKLCAALRRHVPWRASLMRYPNAMAMRSGEGVGVGAERIA